MYWIAQAIYAMWDSFWWRLVFFCVVFNVVAYFVKLSVE